MSANFSITTDPTRDLIRIVAKGFFAVADVTAFAEALDHACVELKCPPHQHLIFVDASAMHIQSQDVVTAFTAIARDPQRRCRRIAMVVGHSLARSQAKRITKPQSDRIVYFHDNDGAEAWLFSDAAAGSAQSTPRDRLAPASPCSIQEQTASSIRHSPRPASAHAPH